MDVLFERGEPSGERMKLVFTRDEETDILAARLEGIETGPPVRGTVEWSSPEGGLLMLDIDHGILAGVEIVVWPEVTVIPGLEPPAGGENGLVAIASGHGERFALEEEVPFAVRRNEGRGLMLIEVDQAPGPCSAVRVCRGFVVELAANGSIAALWLDGMPHEAHD